LFAEQATIAINELASIELQLDPLGHIRGAGISGAGRGGIVEHFEVDDLRLPSR
jgi:hypothetical protein